MRYTTRQVLKILNVSKPTLYKICRTKNINPQKTTGGHYRYSDIDIQLLLNKNHDERTVEDKFINVVNELWIVLKKFSEEVWGIEKGQEKLIEILQKNKDDIFILNISKFKEQ